MANAWLTPDVNPAGSTTCYRLFLPAGEDWLAAAKGALYELVKSENWEKFGSVSVADTVQEYENALDKNLYWSQCMNAGDYVFSASDEVSVGRLLCDGSEYDDSVYPELFDAIGYSYGTGISGKPLLPDFRDRFPVGATGNYNAGDTGGEDAHTLSESEMPAHVHLGHSHPIPGVTGIEVAPVAGQSVATNTSSTGGSQPHENRPPYMATYVYIIAR